jgi:sugar phosphate isomerase/epimerase
MSSSRRRFIQTAIAVPALAGLGITAFPAFAANTMVNPHIRFRLGVASFTFRNFDRARAIQMTNRAGLVPICLNRIHLPMDATDEECAAAAEETRGAGLDFYAGGVVSMNNPAEVTNAFRYARATGIGTIVANPQPAQLSLVEEKVKETGIYIAIHNHLTGPYPTPEAIMEHVGALDKRIGICVDVGHVVRNGADIVRSIHNCKERIYDIHLKDVTEASHQGRECVCGHGVLDIPGCLQALIDIGYDRVVAFEYEVNAADPMPGLMESLGYTRGVLRMIGKA